MASTSQCSAVRWRFDEQVSRLFRTMVLGWVLRSRPYGFEGLRAPSPVGPRPGQGRRRAEPEGVAVGGVFGGPPQRCVGHRMDEHGQRHHDKDHQYRATGPSRPPPNLPQPAPSRQRARPTESSSTAHWAEPPAPSTAAATSRTAVEDPQDHHPIHDGQRQAPTMSPGTDRTGRNRRPTPDNGGRRGPARRSPVPRRSRRITMRGPYAEHGQTCGSGSVETKSLRSSDGKWMANSEGLRRLGTEALA